MQKDTIMQKDTMMKTAIPFNELIEIGRNSQEGFFRITIGEGLNPHFEKNTEPSYFLKPKSWGLLISRLISPNGYQPAHAINILNINGGWELNLRVLGFDKDKEEIKLGVVSFVEYSVNVLKNTAPKDKAHNKTSNKTSNKKTKPNKTEKVLDSVGKTGVLSKAKEPLI